MELQLLPIGSDTVIPEEYWVSMLRDTKCLMQILPSSDPRLDLASWGTGGSEHEANSSLSFGGGWKGVARIGVREPLRRFRRVPSNICQGTHKLVKGGSRPEGP